jgi:hypothetical protein
MASRLSSLNIRWRAASSCLAVLSITFPAYAYRTSEDSPALSDRGRVAWASPHVAFSLNDASLPAGVTKAKMEEALAGALDAWAAPECSVVEPYFAGWTSDAAAAKDGVNTISWVDDWKERGFPSVSPGSTVMQYHGHDGIWEIADADIYLDAVSYDWTTAEGKDTSVQAVLTHEVGHALGLLHPCEPDGDDAAPDCKLASPGEQATTMYPFYDAAQASLDDDDVAGICYLYPVEGACPSDCGKNEMCVEGECRAVCGSNVCAAEETCGFWGCVPPGGCAERYCASTACSTSTECGPLAECVDQVCKSGSVAWGDGCGKSSDCAQGACVDRICQPDCANEAECGTGSCTPTSDGTAKGCTSSRAYERGMHCAVGEDCRSGICIFTANPSVCTDACTTSKECPETWSCRSVEGRDVCVPPTINASGGCTIAAPRGALVANSATDLLAWMLLGGSLFAIQRRRKRSSAIPSRSNDVDR